MQEVTRALFANILDYAGMFPPAALPLEPALTNYLSYLGGENRWMLGRFVCPIAKFKELESQSAAVRAAKEPVGLAALGSASDRTAAFTDVFHADLHAIRTFHDTWKRAMQVDAVEARLPAEALIDGPAAKLQPLLARLLAMRGEAGLARMPIFLEATLSGDWRETFIQLIHCLAECNGAGGAGPPASSASVLASAAPAPLGLKLRTGGLDASAFPSSEQIAFVIEQCRDHRVPIKFTAGLHHPIRRFDPVARAQMHGFLNVFGAAVLAYAVAIDLHDIRAVIEETDLRHFHFSDPFFGWNDAEASAEEIGFLRRTRVISFGSCSMDEPLDDLRAARLLP